MVGDLEDPGPGRGRLLIFLPLCHSNDLYSQKGSLIPACHQSRLLFDVCRNSSVLTVEQFLLLKARQWRKKGRLGLGNGNEELHGMDHRIAAWEIAGILFIIAAGSLFHFVYSLTGNALAAGIFFPVNESVWEHLKLGFWAVVLYAIIEYRFIGGGQPAFIVAKAVGVLTLQLFILVIFYGYHLFTQRTILFLDISSYFVGAAVCQIVSMIILKRVKPGREAVAASVCFLVLHAAVLVLFTFFPPKLPLFMDARTKTHGIQRRL